MAATVISGSHAGQASAPAFVPREHGATAMLLTPFVAAAILLRRVYWPELAVLVAIASAFSLKDPLVVLARQGFLWKQEHAETKIARRSVAFRGCIVLVCGAMLLAFSDWRPFAPLAIGGAAFMALAVGVTVRNNQRAEWFQVASAVALSSTCLAACLAATGGVPAWGWLLWLLCALQSTAGIFVVHARLDARIAARKGAPAASENRRAALVCQIVLVSAAIVFALAARPWIAAALVLAAIGYWAELRRQRKPEFLRMPLQRVGLEALGLTTLYAVLIVVGLWRG
jgi:hypothetical protein